MQADVCLRVVARTDAHRRRCIVRTFKISLRRVAKACMMHVLTRVERVSVTIGLRPMLKTRFRKKSCHLKSRAHLARGDFCMTRPRNVVKLRACRPGQSGDENLRNQVAQSSLVAYFFIARRTCIVARQGSRRAGYEQSRRSGAPTPLRS